MGRIQEAQKQAVQGNVMDHSGVSYNGFDGSPSVRDRYGIEDSAIRGCDICDMLASFDYMI